jgi:DNA phosphorothioation-dependent restriction protein DptH
MRVSDLDAELMVRLGARLRAELPSTTVVVLTDGKLAIPSELAVSSTKLVELRNPHADGSLRQPLLVFVPSEVRASAEDSFGVATFEEVSVTGLYEALITRLIEEIPPALRGSVQESLRRLREVREALGLRGRPLHGAIPPHGKGERQRCRGYRSRLSTRSASCPTSSGSTPPEKAPLRLVRNREMHREADMVAAFGARSRRRAGTR